MRWIKYILLIMGGLAVVILLLIAIVLVTFDNDDYRRFVTRSVKYFTGYAMTIEGPFALRLSSEPSLSAEMIRFASESDKSPPPVTRIGKLRIQVALWPLVRGTLVVRELLVDDVIMAVTIGDEGEPEVHRGYHWKTPPDINIPILESVRLDNIQLDFIDDAANRTVEVRLRQFYIDDVRDSGPLFVKGNGTISGNEFHIDGQLGALTAIFSGAEPYPVDLILHSGGFRVSVSGTVEDLLDGEGLALRLSGEAGELSNLFKQLKIESPSLGDLKLQATVTRDMATPKVSDISVSLSGDARIELAVEGAIDNAITGAGANIQFTGSCENPEVFAWLLPEDLPEFKRMRVAGEVRESAGAIAVENLNLVIGDEQKAALIVTGRIASVLKAADVFVDGIDLTAEARNLPLQPFSDWLGHTVPDLGPLNGRFQIAGGPAQLTVSKAKLTTVSPRGLTIAATGGINRIRLGSEKPLAEVDFSLTATAPGWSALPGAARLDFPDLGPLQMKAAVNDSRGSLDVETFEIRSGTNQKALLRLQGQILDIGRLEQIALQAAVEAASQPWVSKYLNQTEAVNVPLAGEISLTGIADGLRIDEVRFRTTDGERLAIKAQGRVIQLSESPAVELELDITAPDPSAVGSMVGVSLPPFGPLAINGRVNANAQKVNFSGKTHLGDTAFQSTVNAAFNGPRPRIEARFAATRVNLENLGIFPAAPPEYSVTTAEAQPQKIAPLLNNTALSFGALKDYDVYFTLDAAELVARDISIENLDLDIKIENGRLTVHPASMVYAAGFTEFDFTVDASGATPVFDLKITGEDIDIESVLASAHEPLILGGDLNLFVDLQSTGRSSREIASNLGGEVSLALENGEIRRIINFLSADALNLVLTAADQRQSTDLNCLVSKIEFQDGLGEIEFFVMDTSRIRATAAGSVNLAEETIDVGIYPQQKRRLVRREGSAVRINGPLARPVVRTLPMSEAARLYGKLLMPHVFLTERALGSLWYLISKDEDASPCAQIDTSK